MTAIELLPWFNLFFDKAFSLTPEVEAFISGFIDDDCDLGLAYGYIRPWMPDVHTEEEFSRLSDKMQERRLQDYELRSTAISGSRVKNPNIPPRRVWDLYANRVLPYHAMKQDPPKRGKQRLPRNLWAVSHSWCSPLKRQSVLTTVNGKAWHVPIPRGTTLEEIRKELLTLGAEYVFLDVLCLRQSDNSLPEFENIRKREWKLDIPTIGYIYNENKDRPIVVYFDGLGLPMCQRPVDPLDRFHWLKRVWTLQETPSTVIFGGLEDKPSRLSIDKPDTWPSSLAPLLHSVNESKVSSGDFIGALFNISGRSYANPVDQVACLAYLLQCPELPIYNGDSDIEGAWKLLIECLHEYTRTLLLFSDFGRSGSWQPTWKEVMAFAEEKELAEIEPEEREWLKHMDGSSPEVGYKHGFDAYYHTAYVIEDCYIHISPVGNNEYQRGTVEIPLAERSGHESFEVSEWGTSATFDPSAPYLLVGVGKLKYWVVAQYYGVRRINGLRAIEVSKTSTLTIPGSDLDNKDNKELKHKVQVLEGGALGYTKQAWEAKRRGQGVQLEGHKGFKMRVRGEYRTIAWR